MIKRAIYGAIGLTLPLAAMCCASLSAGEFRVPEGFEIRPATDRARVRFPMFAAFDDKRRLFVAESSGLDLYEELQKLTRKCRISLLEDTNADGIFDKSRIFAEQLVFPMGLVWSHDKLYVADPPNLITLEDTDSDGRADKRSVLLSGFGHTDNGSLHGLTFGPDGWLYMTMGQPDGFRIRRSDGKIIEGKSGALLRCRADGSDLEVVCRGFENLVEVVFMPTGEIIGTDNWFFLPQDGVRDALVHLVPGGVYPLNAHAQGERDFFFSGELLPALQVYPAVAHSGLMRYAGGAFPESMRGNLFSAQFNTRKVVRHALARHGSTFQSLDEDFVTTDDPDFHPSDVLEDTDGSIIVVDTGSWYVHHCPTGRIRRTPAEGGLYRVRFKEAGALTAKTNDWTAEIWSSALMKVSSIPIDGKYHPFQMRLDPGWPADSLALWLRALARDINTALNMTNFLAHPAAHVRLAAAEATAAKKLEGAIAAISQALAVETDPLVVHGLIYALYQVANADALQALLKDVRGPVRRAAFLVLDQLPHRALDARTVVNALTDPALRTTALKSLKGRPEWTGEAVALIRTLLGGENAVEQIPALRELIPSFIHSADVRKLVTETISDDRQAPPLRLVMLEALSQSNVPDDANVTAALRTALRSGDAGLISAAVRGVGGRHVEQVAEDLAKVAHSAQMNLAVRLEALRALVRRRTDLDEASFGVLMQALTNNPSVRLGAAEVAAAAELSKTQLRDFIKVATVDRVLSPAIVLSAAQRTKSPDAEVLLDYVLGSVNAGWTIPEGTMAWLEETFPKEGKLAAIRSATTRSLEERLAKLAALEPLLQGGDPNAGHQLFLGKLACATCHRVGKQGGLVGSDLTKIGAIRSGRDLIESLALPSATIAQGYETYHVTLTDGEVTSGIRVRQVDDSFLLRDSSGAELRLSASQIKSVERSSASLMPDGLLGGLEQQEIRDLLAYLQSLR